MPFVSITTINRHTNSRRSHCTVLKMPLKMPEHFENAVQPDFMTGLPAIHVNAGSNTCECRQASLKNPPVPLSLAERPHLGPPLRTGSVQHIKSTPFPDSHPHRSDEHAAPSMSLLHAAPDRESMHR